LDPSSIQSITSSSDFGKIEKNPSRNDCAWGLICWIITKSISFSTYYFLFASCTYTSLPFSISSLTFFSPISSYSYLQTCEIVLIVRQGTRKYFDSGSFAYVKVAQSSSGLFSSTQMRFWVSSGSTSCKSVIDKGAPVMCFRKNFAKSMPSRYPSSTPLAVMAPANLKMVKWSGTRAEVVEGRTTNLLEAILNSPFFWSNNSFEMQEYHSRVSPL